ncbi:TonB-dependent receptor, partial [Nostoc sp. 3335mG]
SKFGIISLGGTVITACPVATATNGARRDLVCTGQLSPTNGRLNNNYLFRPDGTLVRDTPTIDLRPTGGGILGGPTASGVEGAMLLPGLDRINVNLLSHFEVSSAFEPYIEAKYVKITANQTSTQPTFVNGRLTPTFYLDNPYLTDQARTLIQQINGLSPTNTTGAFTFFRFNNDLGTRAEQHERQTYRAVVGARGTLIDTGNWNYDAFVNYGRTDTYYETGGNVDIRKFNNAANAVRDPVSGQIVCRINADASTTNDDPSCRPLNLFGEGAPLTTPEGAAYALYTSSRKQWAEQFNAFYSVSGDTSGFLRLPGGPVGLAFGVEYRREDYFSAYDDFTKGEYAPGQSNTFLNSIQDSNPDAVSVTEAFGEIRVPILADIPFAQELSVEASGRASKYNFLSDAVYAYNVAAIYSPVRGLRLRASYAQATRAPNLAELYGGTSQTFANSFTDPCSQTVIDQDPNRARNCAAAGIPTTITLPDGQVVPWTNAPTSGILGTNGGNALLEPEVSRSFVLGGVFAPRFLPGFSVTVDYYNIEIKQAIDSISPQALVNRCYDDPGGLNNPFCAQVIRRRSTDPIADFTFAGQQGRRFAGFPDFNIGLEGNGFTNGPFN